MLLIIIVIEEELTFIRLLLVGTAKHFNIHYFMQLSPELYE